LHAVTGETFTATNESNPVNGAGVIAGYVVGHENDQREAAVFDTRTSTVRHLGSLVAGLNSQASDVNIRGDVVGSAYVSANVTHAFVVRAGSSTMTVLGPTDPQTDSDASSINDHGVVAGVVQGPGTPFPNNYAVTWTLGAGSGFTTFELGKTVGSTQSGAGIVNNGGYILFTRTDKRVYWGFVWIPEHHYALQIKPLPGDDNVRMNDMNDAGFAVGWSFESKKGVARPILWNSQTQTTQLLPDVPDSVGTVPAAINAHGTIVGNAVVEKGATGWTAPVVWTGFGATVATLPTGSNPSANVFGINVYGLVVGHLGEGGQTEGTETWKPSPPKTATR
jgi:uncharacterized membrane protein